MREKILELFWSNLHTTTIDHGDQPNEPHRQVIFKEEIPQIADAILEVMIKELPAKMPIGELKSKPCPYSTKIRCCTMQDCIRNETIAEIQAKLRGE